MSTSSQTITKARPRLAWRIAVAMALCGLLASCANRGTMVVAPEATDVGQKVPIIVATTRGPKPEPEFFSSARSDIISFARFDVSVPPDRRAGEVRFPRGTPPNPRTEFVTVSATPIDGSPGFIAAVNEALDTRPFGKRSATVFVHGYNTNFVEGLYRQAQLHHDFDEPGLSINYSWPSAAEVRYYVYDVESAIFAKSGLDSTINALTRTRVEGITLVAHSMGGQVLMETLRQMALRGNAAGFRKIKDIVLLSPDVNLDIFRAQLQEISRYEIPIYVVVSGNDRALRLSSRLRGEKARLGNLRDNPWENGGYNVKLIDLTKVKGGDPMRHFSAGSSPSVIALVRGLNDTGTAIFDDADGRTGFFDASIDIIDEGADLLLNPRGGL
jgi:esterase/lipase superfamily enzyme